MILSTSYCQRPSDDVKGHVDTTVNRHIDVVNGHIDTVSDHTLARSFLVLCAGSEYVARVAHADLSGARPHDTGGAA